MRKLRVALVGCGRISVCYKDAFHRLSDQMELVWAVDKDIEKAKEFASHFNCSYTANFDEILDKEILMWPRSSPFSPPCYGNQGYESRYSRFNRKAHRHLFAGCR